MMTVISLGAGVQSSTMALMAARGEITPMPDCAIFADTQSEPKHIYEWLDWLEKQLPFPVCRVTATPSGRHWCGRRPSISEFDSSRRSGYDFFANLNGRSMMWILDKDGDVVNLAAYEYVTFRNHEVDEATADPLVTKRTIERQDIIACKFDHAGAPIEDVLFTGSVQFMASKIAALRTLLNPIQL